MSTGYDNTAAARIALLLKNNEIVFHASDLAVLWGISSLNTLYTTLSRYCKAKLLFRIYKGLYSSIPVKQIDPLLIGLKALHKYCYISTETVLLMHGIIFQDIQQITIISSISKQFTVAGRKYKSRQLSYEHLMNPTGIQMKAGIKIASLERAVADWLYFSPNAHFDNNSQLDFRKLQNIQRKVGYNVSTKIK